MPASASSAKSFSSMPGSITGAPAWTFTPLARNEEKQRCAVIAMAVDQAGRERDAVGVDRRRRAGAIEIGGAADGADPAIDGDERVRVQDRPRQVDRKSTRLNS